MEERDYQSLLVQQDGHIVTLTFNKPEKKNPLSQEVINELLWALDDAEAADDVRVIILTGAGNAFSAGADLKGMNADRGTLEKKGEFDDLMLRFDTLKKPIVARIRRDGDHRLLSLRHRLRKRDPGDAGDQARLVPDDDHGGASTGRSHPGAAEAHVAG
jgi:hypothetical protein